jgi:hypothetical protein
MNLLELLNIDGFNLEMVTTIKGGEYAGPCPWCGGKDRFLVWPDQKGGRYWCRQCEKKGDSIQYLRDFHNLPYFEACQKVGIEPAKSRFSALPRRLSKPAFTPKVTTVPDSHWRNEATAFLNAAKRNLWTDANKDAQTFLHGKGLSDETIRAASLGWNPKDIYRDRKIWGLLPEIKDNGKPNFLWLPAGLVIPCFTNEKIIRLRIRRLEGDPRYVIISGSDTRPMTWSMNRKVIIIVESELDGLLLQQEAGDLVGVVALGSAQAKPDILTHDALTNADKILVSLDTDDAGAKAAWGFWPKTYGSKVKRWPCIMGKDPSEAWRNGLDIRAWIIAGMGSFSNSTNTTNIETKQRTLHEDLLLAECYACGGRNYWKSLSGAKWICERCHPPATEEIVSERRQS